MNTQIFIKQISEKVFNLNGKIYSLLEMDEESLIALAKEAEEGLKTQKGKISTAELNLANALAKRPSMDECDDEKKFEIATKKFQYLFDKWQKAVTTSKGHLNNTRVKKGLLQNLITQIGFAYTSVISEVSITNIDTGVSTKVTVTEAKVLTQQEDWVYTEAYKSLI